MTLQQEIDRLLGRGKPITDAHIRGLCVKYKKYKKATIEKMIQDSMKPDIEYKATTPESFDGKRLPPTVIDESALWGAPVGEVETIGTLTFDDLMEFAATISPQQTIEHFSTDNHFDIEKSKTPTGPVTVTVNLRNMMLHQKIRHMYRDKFNTEPDIEALKSDAEANPEGSAELLGVQLTQMLIQL